MQREKGINIAEKVKLFFANGIILYLQIPETQLKTFRNNSVMSLLTSNTLKNLKRLFPYMNNQPIRKHNGRPSLQP